MAAEALEAEAAEMHIAIKVETNGADGVKNHLKMCIRDSRKIGVDVSGGILDLTVGPAGKLAEDNSEDDDEGNKAEHHQGCLLYTSFRITNIDCIHHTFNTMIKL